MFMSGSTSRDAGWESSWQINHGNPSGPPPQKKIAGLIKGLLTIAY